MQRFSSEETRNELISSLKYIFPIESVQTLTEEEIHKELETSDKKETVNLFWSGGRNGLIAVLYHSGSEKKIATGYFISLLNDVQDIDLVFGDYFCQVFNDDITIIPIQEKHSEVWMTLKQSQFSRAIAKFSSFNTNPMIKWLQIAENSTHLQYENKPFTFCMLMAKKKECIQQTLLENFMPFSQPVQFEKGIMEEKWIRGSMSENTVGIAGYGENGDIFGMFTMPEPTLTDAEIEQNTLLAPHEDLIPLIARMPPKTFIMMTSENGSIYVVLPKRTLFHKTQGKWHYVNYSNIHIMLSKYIKKEIALSILRLVLDLSYERKGTLIFIPKNEEILDEIIPDYCQSEKVNETLRNTVKGLNVCHKIHRKIIMAAAKVDGAVVISKSGEVLDVSCMIGEPDEIRLTEHGLKNLEVLPGARSTAAWNASIYGIAVKVSDDGPISIYRHGKLITYVG
ncbi:diadenylate cyclase [Methanimicrococcus blatticola]|uniref:DisA checkpoint controller-like protein n=1 Tax=Methanimicrococcus blatticola TaxID=91560 RepID=A0A484F650_9EURY|nr:diadenylate cyclase [Methanimicrococcus blatticola]MBZ3935178.1 diadenylate cyclase [Methanimicrococcus blatticola]MCC2508725.1 diadenylate cyclase [Methanimicrococcus blatticola]TDQ71239.1 DisA checkpoint controller-like protein [Methanimicrococcus blatticola]